jgi:hypothetical protein
LEAFFPFQPFPSFSLTFMLNYAAEDMNVLVVSATEEQGK